MNDISQGTTDGRTQPDIVTMQWRISSITSHAAINQVLMAVIPIFLMKELVYALYFNCVWLWWSTLCGVQNWRHPHRSMLTTEEACWWAKELSPNLQCDICISSS